MTYYSFLRLKDDQAISDWDGSAFLISSVLTIFNGGSYESGVSSLDTACGGPGWSGKLRPDVFLAGRPAATCWAPVSGSTRCR